MNVLDIRYKNVCKHRRWERFFVEEGVVILDLVDTVYKLSSIRVE